MILSKVTQTEFILHSLIDCKKSEFIPFLDMLSQSIEPNDLSSEILNNSNDNDFIEVCKDSKTGLFMNVKVDFKKWFEPSFQSHLLYQDIASRYKQLSLINNSDFENRANIVNPFRRVIFLTEDKWNKAIQDKNCDIFHQRRALQRCHMAMGIALGFVRATTVIDFFKSALKYPELDEKNYSIVNNYISFIKENPKRWTILGFDESIFRLLCKLDKIERVDLYDHEKQIWKKFDEAIRSMDDSQKTNKDRVIGTIDCAVFEGFETEKRKSSVWGAVLYNSRGKLRIQYYNLDLSDVNTLIISKPNILLLDENDNALINKDRMPKDKYQNNLRKKIGLYKESIREFSKLVERMVFKPLSSVDSLDEKKPDELSRKKYLKAYNPIIDLWDKRSDIWAPNKISDDDFGVIWKNDTEKS